MGTKKLVMTVVAVLAVAVVVVLGIMSNMSSPEPEATGSDTPTSSATAIPLPEQTFVPEPSIPATVAPQPTTAPVSPSPSPSLGGVPDVAPTLKPIAIEGFGYSAALEANLSPEEIQVRETIYKTIPMAANRTSTKYATPLAARDEMVKAGLITDNMANTWFLPHYTPYQEDIRKADYTIQTTGIKCIMRTITPETVLQTGKVTCYFNRMYVDADGNAVSNAAYVESTGGAGSIDPSQTSRVEVGIKQEGGSWKVDNLIFN